MHRPASFDEPLEGQWPLFQDPPSQPADFEVRRGDVFALGDTARIMCGDATSREDVATLFGGQKPTLVVTSPPYADCRDYNDPIPCWDTLMMGAFDGHDFADDVQMLINLGVIHRKNEWVPYWWGWLQSMRQKRWKIVSQYVWNKINGIPGCNTGRARPAHEFIFHLAKQNRAMIKTLPCAGYNKRKTSEGGTKKKNNKKDGWRGHVGRPCQSHKLENSVFTLHNEKSNRTGHPAVYPVELPRRLIAAFRSESGACYDPFLGSGSTALAATDEGVACLGMELSPQYCQIALKRWAKAHPDKPVRRL